MANRTPSHSQRSPRAHDAPRQRGDVGTFQHVDVRERGDDGRSTAGVIVVGVAHDEPIEPAPPARGERRQHDLLAAVESRARRRPRIEQQPLRCASRRARRARGRRRARRLARCRAAATAAPASRAAAARAKPGGCPAAPRRRPRTRRRAPLRANAGHGGSGTRHAAKRQLGDRVQAAHRETRELSRRVHERRRPLAERVERHGERRQHGQRHEAQVEKRNRNQIHQRADERNFAEVPRGERQQRKPDPPLQTHELERERAHRAATVRRPACPRSGRRERQQDRDRDERQPERRRQRRERVPDEHDDERRRDELRGADAPTAHERRERDRDHDERTLRRHGEARQRRVVTRGEQTRTGGDLEVVARERARQPQPDAAQRDEHDDTEQRDVHARYGHEVARARAAKVRPMLLAEAEALAESERSQQRRAVGIAARGADALGELAAKLEPPRPEIAAGRLRRRRRTGRSPLRRSR